MGLKVCVLQPDYSTTAVDYQYYDPARDLSPYLPDAIVDHVLLNKLTTYKQLKALQKKGYDIFVNLCEGYLEWEVPSIDVIYSMEQLGLPHTGPTTQLYDPPKELMKYVAHCEGIKSPPYVIIDDEADINEAVKHLRFPMFIKPAKAGDSLGVDHHSLVSTKEELVQKVKDILPEYSPLMAEEYIKGREFTVLIAANADGISSTTFTPVEYIFPDGFAFKTYQLKTSELHPDANIPVRDPVIDQELRRAAQLIFEGFNGKGYARLDFRMNEKGELFFLEINFTCSVFYADGYEGSADYILLHDGYGKAGFLRHIIEEGIARHKRKQHQYFIKGTSIAGFGIYASSNLLPGYVLFNGEGKAQRMVTRRHVEMHWNEADKETFRRYAYPVSRELFILWDENPSEWAPQNHSCDPNTAYDGLNVVTTRSIKKGEELTLDYASFLDEHMEPFQCQCGSDNCRGLITGIPGNSINKREMLQYDSFVSKSR